MNTSRILALSAALGGCLFLSACDTGPMFPASFQIPLSTPYFTSDYGVDNMAVVAVQDVETEAGTRVYYEFSSPTPVILSIYDKFGPNVGPMIAQVRGNSYRAGVMPSGHKLRFVFSPIVVPIPAGTVQLTVSDRPVAEPSTAVQVQYVAPAPQYVTPSPQYASPAPTVVVPAPATSSTTTTTTTTPAQ